MKIQVLTAPGPGNRRSDHAGFDYLFRHLNGDFIQALLHATADCGCAAAAGSAGR